MSTIGDAATAMRAVPVLLVLGLGLALAGPAQATRCTGTTPHGEHVGAANNFQVHRIRCRDALVSADDYTDSNSAEQGLKAVQERGAAVSIRFTARTQAGSHHWTCQLAELPRREQHPPGSYSGWRYECRAGRTEMSFKWWTWPDRMCPTTGSVEGLRVTRNERCPAAGEYLEPKGQYETRTGTSTYEEGSAAEKHPYQWERRFYHDSGFLCVSESVSYQPSRLGWECVQQTSVAPAAYWWRKGLTRRESHFESAASRRPRP